MARTSPHHASSDAAALTGRKPVVSNLHYLTWLWVCLGKMMGNARANQQVAFTRGGDGAVAVANGDALSPALDETGPLQSLSCLGDRRSVHTQHFCQQVLCDGQAILVMSVA